MLKKSASFGLASLRSSSVRHKVRLASSLAAAALDGLFEHPVECSGVICDNVPWRASNALTLFFNKLPERIVRVCPVACICYI
jgi:hypothetical protein